MEPVPLVGWGFFPLDEQLGLTRSRLSPRYEEHLVHLAAWMPFAHAAHMLETLEGVQVSEATVRRHTEDMGTICEVLQNDPERRLAERAPAPERFAISADGAFVPLLGGTWAEVRTLAIGEVSQTGMEVRTTKLSYFSRMTDAETFRQLVEGETRHRQVLAAKQVVGVMDGADWLQGLLDLHRPDAVRILDFPHAAQRVSAILDLLQQEGRVLPCDAIARCLHLLKHRGPRPVLRWLRYLTRGSGETSQVREHLAYLHKRESLMQYPSYQADGWPIGSGMVESANKLVMQARLKGAGMHWQASHVNPMLALRLSVCNDRWSQDWEPITARLRSMQQQTRLTSTKLRQHQATTSFVLAWMRFLLPSRPLSQPTPAPRPAAMVVGKPTAHHPWKRAVVACPKGSAKK
jgi:hypothetical protein